MDRNRLLESYKAHVSHVTEVYRKALEGAGYDAVLVHSGTALKRTQFDDQYWPLRVVPHFQHWAPLPWADAAMVARRVGAPTLLAYRDMSYWERFTAPDFDLIKSALEVVDTTSPTDVGRHVAPGTRVAFIGDNLERAREWGVKPDDVNPPSLLSALDELRVFKTEYEQLCLKEANRIACLGHDAVAKAFAGGERSELNLHLLYLQATRQDDPETPYKNIVAIGSSAAILHHISYRKDRLEGPQSLLVDAGATFNGYASDITRTHVAPGGEDAALFGELIRRLESLQQALCANATVGRPYESLHDESHERLAVVLSELGVMKMGTEEMVKNGVTRLFLPHGLGHSLGLQCHDVGCAKVKPRPENPWLRNTRVIEPGQCFTIEPGVYFIDTLMEQLRGGPHGVDANWKAIDALRPFGGIRIEDDLVVRAGGQPADNLTRAFLA